MGAPGERPKGGNRLPPGVNKGGVMPGNFAPGAGGFKLDKLGICKLCLLLFAEWTEDVDNVFRPRVEPGADSPGSLDAKERSKGLGSSSKDVFS